jgi:hypothetical protein
MTVFFSSFNSGGLSQVGDVLVGLRNNTNYQFTFPASGINDAIGNLLLGWSSPGSIATPAVNTLSITSAITGTNPILSPIGTDANIGLNISTVGTGKLKVLGTGGIVVPFGSTAQRPTGTSGLIRVNTDTGLLEFWDNLTAAYVSMGAIGSISVAAPITTTGGINPTIGLTTPLSPTYGGTGVNNGASTITIGGNVTFSGAHLFTGTLSGDTTVTFPTSGTLVNSGVSTLSSLVSIGTIVTGTWHSDVITGTYGGTGVNNGVSTITIGGNVTFSGAHLFTGTLTADTTVTFPTTGTLLTSAGAVTSLTGTANQITASSGTGAVTLSIPNNPVLPGTGGVQISTGTTGQRAGVAGTMRFNSTTTLFEGTVDGTNWASFATGSSVVSVSGTANQIDVSPTTGACIVSIDANYVGQNSIVTVGTITTGGWAGTSIPLNHGGTNTSLTASAGGIVWSDSSKLNILSGTTTANQLLLSGNAATPAWSTSTYPSTNAINTLLYASAANTMNALTTANSGVLVTSSAGVPSILSAGTTGQFLSASTAGTPAWSTARYPSTVALGDVLVASATNVVGIVNNVANAGYVLTANVGAAPTFQAAASGGIVTLDGDSSTATGATVTIAGTTNQITTTGNGAAQITISIPSSPSLAGTTTVATGLTTTNGAITVNSTSATTATGAEIDMQRTHGAGVSITSGDYLGDIFFKGYDGSNQIISSSIKSISSGTIAANRVASDLEFFTHPDSTTSSTQRMVISPVGGVTINSPDSGVGLTVSGGGITCTSGAITATSGNIVVTSGNLTLPTTTSTAGQIKINGSPWAHAYGTNNVFVGGAGNLTLSGTDNCLFGTNAGANISTSGLCVAIGSNALTTGSTSLGGDVAVGCEALYLATGAGLTAVGYQAGKSLTSGSNNTFLGYNCAYNSVTIGSSNVFLGDSVGNNYTSSESSNILIGSNTSGIVGESNVLRIGKGTGTAGGQINAAYISGITGITVTGTAVLVSTSNQLGIAVSSAKYKKDITDMPDMTEVIEKLRPVTFHYKDEKQSAQLNYGLIAEEVEEILPEMVAYDKDGQISTLYYQFLAPILLKEVQNLRKELEELKKRQ